jgi:(1->4)-alpha-D-glucan 1-alpha-D-glucosylmutase
MKDAATNPNPTEVARELITQASALLRARPRPVATYRVQFHRKFSFVDAANIVPYLSALGVSHLYASPIMAARVGSTHGYDVVDHNRLNPELGSPENYQQLCEVLREREMGQILDTVPNHCGVGTNDNAWWNDVLEHGRESERATFFDITWDGSPRSGKRGTVLLPVLGRPYAQALEAGELRLELDESSGALRVAYFDRLFPVTPWSYSLVLGSMTESLGGRSALKPEEIRRFHHLLQQTIACSPPEGCTRGWVQQEVAALLRQSPVLRDVFLETVSNFNGTPGNADSFDALDLLLQAQHYRLAWWRVAPDEINYRRFFDINDLAGLATERPEVFDEVHRLTLQLVAEGAVDGVRIDHPDGLYDPAGYFGRLQQAALAAVAGRLASGGGIGVGVDPGTLQSEIRRLASESSDRLLPVWAEKILAVDEALPTDWPIDGTSGYDFMNFAGSLFVDPAAEPAFDKLYRELLHGSAGHELPQYDELVYRNKKLIMQRSLASELRMLTVRLDAVAQMDRSSRDHSQAALQEALRETVACFPVYRSYITRSGSSSLDAQRLEQAISEAIARSKPGDNSAFLFLRDVLLLRAPQADTDLGRQACAEIAGRFQQLTAPVTAKGIEDTTFYVFNRFVALNEVGGDPSQFGLRPDQVHAYFADRQTHWPFAMSTLSTHDTKRSEDVRARLYALSEQPDVWREHVQRWVALNARFREAAGHVIPSPNDEYLLYQTLVGIWPVSGGATPDEPFVARVQAYMLKAVREAKTQTTWTEPNEVYETGLRRFIASVLDAHGNGAFLREVDSFASELAWFGWINSLAMTTLKLFAPGVPDTYQGTELWDLSLVDPDNRRPVDYGVRREGLSALQAAYATRPEGEVLADVLATPGDGRIKLLLTWLGLRLRRERAELFRTGTYVPLAVEGPGVDHLFSFALIDSDSAVVVAVPRLLRKLGFEPGKWAPADRYRGTRIVCAGGVGSRRYRSLLSGRQVEANTALSAAELMDPIPIAILISD